MLRLGSSFIVAAVVLVFASQASAATITVNSAANTTGGPNCTLRDAITAANSNAAQGGCGAGSGADTIAFSLSNPSVIDLGSGLGTALPNTNSDITITGPGSQALTIGSATPNSLNFTLLTQQTGTLNVSGVTLKGAGRTGYVGGGVQQSDTSGHLSLDDVVVTGNTSDCGAGIRMEGTEGATITDSVISENHGNSCTAGVSVTTPSSAVTTIENTSIVGNGSPDNGAMYNQGDTTIVNSTMSGNTSSGNTGGITNFGDMTILNSTFTGNTAVGDVGVLRSYGSVVMNNSTVTGNAAGDEIGGLAQAGGTFTIANSIVSSNTAPTAGPDCLGTMTSEGYNLIGTLSGCTLSGDTTGTLIGQDPQLESLSDNGGRTSTMALGIGSPALGTGNPGAIDGALDGALRHCQAADQRSLPRMQGSCDIGAWQYQPPAPPPTPGPTPTPTPTLPTSPAISKLKVSAAKPKRPVNSLTFTFDLSQAATIEMVVQRKFGRKRREKCEQTTKKTQTRKRCPIYREVRTRTIQASAGLNQVKLDVKNLNPGAYRTSFTATNANGASSAARVMFYRPWW